jgi:hypothetical protein
LGQFAQKRQAILDLLLFAQALREGGQDAPRQRDVGELDVDAGGMGEGLDNGEQRPGGERGGLVGQGGVNRVGCFGHCFTVVLG